MKQIGGGSNIEDRNIPMIGTMRKKNGHYKFIIFFLLIRHKHNVVIKMVNIVLSYLFRKLNTQCHCRQRAPVGIDLSSSGTS
jgi:hypothetical protein